MTTFPDQLDSPVPIAKLPQYHPPVLVEYGGARNLTRSNNASIVPDGGPIHSSVGTEDGGLRAPIQGISG